MSTISSANFLTIADNIAKSLRDLETALITNVGSNSPTATTITNGQNAASNSLLARVASLNDATQENALVGAAVTDAANVAGLVVFSMNTFRLQYKELFKALETHTGGVNAFLTTNTAQVDPYFSDAFNYVQGLAPSLGLGTMTAIAVANIFPKQEVSLATIAVTGVSAGTFAAGAALDTTKYASQQLFIKNTGGGGSVGTATSFTITYTNAAGTTGQTVTQALSGSLGAAGYLAAGTAVGQAVSNIVINSGGSNGDTFGIVVKPLRGVTY